MGVPHQKELVLMTSALKDNGSTARWRKIRQRILERDQYTCQACGLEGNTVDHIIPRSLGVEMRKIIFNVYVFGVIVLKAV